LYRLTAFGDMGKMAGEKGTASENREEVALFYSKIQ